MVRGVGGHGDPLRRDLVFCTRIGRSSTYCRGVLHTPKADYRLSLYPTASNRCGLAGCEAGLAIEGKVDVVGDVSIGLWGGECAEPDFEQGVGFEGIDEVFFDLEADIAAKDAVAHVGIELDFAGDLEVDIAAKGANFGEIGDAFFQFDLDVECTEVETRNGEFPHLTGRKIAGADGKVTDGEFDIARAAVEIDSVWRGTKGRTFVFGLCGWFVVGWEEVEIDLAAKCAENRGEQDLKERFGVGVFEHLAAGGAEQSELDVIEIGLHGDLIFARARERAVEFAAGDLCKEGGREATPEQREDGETGAHLWELHFGDALGDEALEVEFLDLDACEVVGSQVIHLDAHLDSALDRHRKSVKQPSVGESLVEKEEERKEGEGGIPGPSEDLL